MGDFLDIHELDWPKKTVGGRYQRRWGGLKKIKIKTEIGRPPGSFSQRAQQKRLGGQAAEARGVGFARVLH